MKPLTNKGKILIEGIGIFNIDNIPKNAFLKQKLIIFLIYLIGLFYIFCAISF